MNKYLTLAEAKKIQDQFEKMIDLPFKPCPFCGSKDIKIEESEDELGWVIQCQKCYAEGPYEDSQLMASAKWNERKNL